CKTLKVPNAVLDNVQLGIKADNLDLSDSSITGISTVEGEIEKLSLANAQLGSDVESSASIDWKIKTGDAEIAGLKIGNAFVHHGTAFGNAPNSEWKTVRIIGLPSFLPDAASIFTVLSKVANFDGEVAPLASNGGKAAKRFKLG